MMRNDREKGRKWLRKSAIILAWLVIWQIVSLWVDNLILLVDPAAVFIALLERMGDMTFWQTILFSLIRISTGFLAGWILGLLLAAVSVAVDWAEEVLKPVMTLMKTVPVASFVVLFLIWFRSEYLAIAISLCVALPGVYFNTLEGIKSTDPKLLEMAGVFGLHPLDRFFYIYRPALKPFWDSCMKLSIGMSWKAGVAAEVIGTPDFSIGEQLYMSKIYLDTAGVLAWTAVIIVISTLCEKGCMKLWHKFMTWQPDCRGAAKGSVESPEETVVLSLQDVSKTYDGNPVLSRLNAEYKKGEYYYFTTPSGSGKTTLFRLIAGLEKPDSGEIEVVSSLAYAFQEDRLCESYSALKNVELVTGNSESSYKYLIPLLTEEEIRKPCCALSGGMKRRVAVARAFAAERDIVFLDEPFAGLDEENRRRMQQYIAECGKGKAVLIATHV